MTVHNAAGGIVHVHDSHGDSGLTPCVQALEDLYTHYDMTVRNAAGGIVQFVYGDDGMDPVTMEGKGASALDFDKVLGKVCEMNHLLFLMCYY